ncbi:MAG: TadE/TadG family type IV pilus assembly protein [Caulobacteraceae bacterium]
MRTWLGDETGASAAELALLLTPLTLMIFGTVHLCLMTFSAMQLNYAVEATARCIVTSAASAYSGSPCYTSAGTDNYFTALYRGITPAPTVTYCNGTGFSNCMNSTYACTGTAASTNYQVVATANYRISAGIVTQTVPLQAKACFPHG